MGHIAGQEVCQSISDLSTRLAKFFLRQFPLNQVLKTLFYNIVAQSFCNITSTIIFYFKNLLVKE